MHLKKGGNMKLYANNQVYLQTYEMSFIISDWRTRPDFVLRDILELIHKEDAKEHLDDPYCFYWKFQTAQSIEWLMNYEAIVDYQKYWKCSIAELEDHMRRCMIKWEEMLISPEYDTRFKEEYLNCHCKKKSDFYIQFEELTHTLFSWRRFVKYKKGIIDFPNLPEEYRDYNRKVRQDSIDR